MSSIAVLIRQFQTSLWPYAVILFLILTLAASYFKRTVRVRHTTINELNSEHDSNSNVIGMLMADLVGVCFSLLQFLPHTRTILLTGCDTGLGYSTALSLLRHGCTVIAGCLTESGERDLQNAAGGVDRAAKHWKVKGRLETVRLDVTSQESIDAAIEKVRQISPDGIHVLVNNAGTMRGSHLVEFTTIESYQHIMDVNWLGMVRMCKAALPLLKLAKSHGERGLKIINISSFLGRVAPFSMSSYSSSKYAVEGFTDSLRQELFSFGIDVVLIEPGSMKTPMAQEMKYDLLQGWENAPNDLKEEYGPSYLTAIDRSARLLDYLASPVDSFTRSLVDIILVQFPRHRYILGKDAWIFILANTFIPSWLNDLAGLTILGQPTPTTHHGRIASKASQRKKQY